MSQALDIRSFPLRGSQLIEASAGTGKTFTIALLYARLILQHGGNTAFPRALSPEDILVVTFTDAATQELKDRIRARLADAARCFLNPEDDCDEVLGALRSDYSTAQWPQCARLLSLAAQSMDQAAVSTIHGWCYRMLREHAFDSGSLFQQTLVTNQQDMFADLIRDYWRQHFYALPVATVHMIHREFSEPEALLQAVRPLIHKTNTELTFAGQLLPEVTELDQALAGFASQAQAIARLQDQARNAWLDGKAELEDLLDHLQPVLNKNVYAAAKNPDDFSALKQSLANWAQGDEAPDRMGRFAQDQWKLSGGKKAPAQPQHPALAAIADWQAAEDAASNSTGPDVRAIVLSHARRWLETALQKRLHEKAELGFDDLLLQLDRALQGPLGDKLATQIRNDYPVAMIDEFQDTDPLQYRIFDKIYQIGRNLNDSALIMIGDPKQAIYSFRNADIHTYLAARQATTGRHFNLGTNYRSTAGVVDGINHLFRQAEEFDEGAFRFKEGNYNPLPFLSVNAKDRHETLLIKNRIAPAITFWHLGSISNNNDDIEDSIDTIPITGFRDSIARRCASEIACWLHDSATGFKSGTGFVRLRPKDIAILVRHRGEANEIRSALQEYGLASVYLSDRESVFSSAEARDVLRWLRACAEPADERKLRAALATASLDLSLAQLEKLNRDEMAWEAETELFRQLHQLWRTQGVLPMLRQLMQFHQLPRRLISSAGGERRLTNLLHLAEYLQKASAQYEGEQALIRHLAEQMQNPGDEEVLRLESDNDLIRVVTVHKAKGLEYPLVCLPFAPALKQIDSRVRQVVILGSDKSSTRRLEIAGNKIDADAWQQADHERLSEDMRLLYVALTRARYGIWLGAAAISVGNSSKTVNHKGALGYLMGGGAPLTAIDVADALQRWSEDCDNISLKPAPKIRHPHSFARTEPEPEANASKPALVSRRSPAENWWISSYSALKTGTTDHGAGIMFPQEPEAPRDDQAQEEHLTIREQTQESHETARREFSRHAKGLHGFHRGPKPGTFLHGLLEWAESEGFATAANVSEARRTMLIQRCTQRGWQDDIDRLDSWLTEFLNTPFVLPGGSTFKLTQLQSQPQSQQAEMEFLFASHQVAAQELDKLCQRFIQPGRPRPALLPTQLNGMMKGFIDLVFEHQGRYYVADWKSNFLGPDDSSYTAPALSHEILHNRYDVQYAIYLLALHRLLRSRLPDYDYNRHLGGALYFFLRGHASQTQGLLADKPPIAFIEAMDALFRHEQGSISPAPARQEVLF